MIHVILYNTFTLAKPDALRCLVGQLCGEDKDLALLLHEWRLKGAHHSML